MGTMVVPGLNSRLLSEELVNHLSGNGNEIGDDNRFSRGASRFFRPRKPNRYNQEVLFKTGILLSGLYVPRDASLPTPQVAPQNTPLPSHGSSRSPMPPSTAGSARYNYASSPMPPIQDSPITARDSSMVSPGSTASSTPLSVSRTGSPSKTPGRHSDMLTAEPPSPTKDIVLPTQLPSVNFKSEREKTLTYELAALALKYSDVIETILDDCAMLVMFPELLDARHLTIAIICDAMMRGFETRIKDYDEVNVTEVLDVERLIMACKVKLAASLARRRIIDRARCLSQLLPERLVDREHPSHVGFIYAWVNKFLTTTEGVLMELHNMGVDDVKTVAKIDGSFCFCLGDCGDDLLVFPSTFREKLFETDLVKSKKIFFQDKSVMLAVYSVRYLLNIEDDVLMTNVGSGLTAMHLASLLSEIDSTLYACGVANPKHRAQLTELFEKSGVTNIRLIDGNFTEMELNDLRLRVVKLVFVNPVCTRSGVRNLTSFMIAEGEDADMMRDLLLPRCDDSRNRASRYAYSHTQTLKFALGLPAPVCVVYSTLSVHETENVTVVRDSLSAVNQNVDEKKIRNLYQLCPPVIALSAEEIDTNVHVHDKVVLIPPSQVMDGCFLAVMAREVEQHKESAKDILARANAIGLLKKPTSASPTHEEYDAMARDIKKKRRKKKGSAKSPEKAEIADRNSKSASTRSTPGSAGGASGTNSPGKTRKAKSGAGSSTKRTQRSKRMYRPVSSPETAVRRLRRRRSELERLDSFLDNSNLSPQQTNAQQSINDTTQTAVENYLGESGKPSLPSTSSTGNRDPEHSHVHGPRARNSARGTSGLGSKQSLRTKSNLTSSEQLLGPNLDSQLSSDNIQETDFAPRTRSNQRSVTFSSDI